MLQLQRLRRRFGDLVALDGLSFDVAEGQLVGFVGANGAGKTTAMRIVMGVDRPDEGAVLWGGVEADRVIRKRFGYMPEERGLYPKVPAVRQLTYLGRLRGMDARDAEAESRRLLGELGLAQRADEPVEQLSQGNQQRVQLAAALVHDPVLLVLDEPFSGLDPVGVDVMSEVLLDRVRSGVAAVFSSHQLELVEELCDAVVIIDHGRPVAKGTVAELRKRDRPPCYRIGIEGASPHWADALPGVVVRSVDAGSTLIELDGPADTDDVLDAARRAGRLTHFTQVVPRLSELYREVVSVPGSGSEERSA